MVNNAVTENLTVNSCCWTICRTIIEIWTSIRYAKMYLRAFNIAFFPKVTTRIPSDNGEEERVREWWKRDGMERKVASCSLVKILKTPPAPAVDACVGGHLLVGRCRGSGEAETVEDATGPRYVKKRQTAGAWLNKILIATHTHTETANARWGCGAQPHSVTRATTLSRFKPRIRRRLLRDVNAASDWRTLP